MPRLHPREEIVTKAELDLRDAISDWDRRHPELTSLEWLKVVLGLCNERALSLIKYQVRTERHGNTDKPGGLE